MEFNAKLFIHTKMKLLIFLSVMSITMLSCKSENRNYSEKTTEDSLKALYNQEYLTQMNLYILEKDSIKKDKILDELLLISDKLLKLSPQDYNFILRKVLVLTEKREYNKAMELVRPLELYVDDDYPYKEILMTRIQAMECQSLGDENKKKELLQKCLFLIDSYLTNHQEELKVLYTCNEEEFPHSPCFVALLQQYACQAELYGKSEAQKKLKQKIEYSKLLQEWIETIFDDPFRGLFL